MEFRLSERTACKLLGVERSSYRNEPRADRNIALREELVKLARQKPRYGYRRLHALLERRGHEVNVKRIYRLYAEEGLAVRRRKRKRLVRDRALEPRLIRPNQEWAMDFIIDGLATGRMVRILSVVDAYTRECLALEADTSLGSGRVTRVLERLIGERGRPENLRSDNGPEFTSRRMLGWAEDWKVGLVHIQPGRPMQNGHVESFHGRLRDACLNASWFLCSIYGLRGKEVRTLTLEDFNWISETFTVRRAKSGRFQEFPIQFEVGEIILRYLQEARPACGIRQLFVTLKPPYRPLHQVTLGRIIKRRTINHGIESEYFGTHALRHACATELLRKGASLSEIADFLGHRDIRSVCVYAKFDSRSLKKVAAFSLAGVR